MPTPTLLVRSLLLSIALWISPLTTAHTQGQPSSSPATGDSLATEAATPDRPDFRLLRQREDWSALAGHDDGLAVLKYVPLTRTGDPFLTIGGEVRSYGRWYRHEQWGAGPARDGYLLQRLMLHGALKTARPHDGMHFRGFVQLKSGLVADRDGPVYPPDKDLLGVNQAFVEMDASLGTGRLLVRIGRQELHYGAGRMIAVREGPNVRLGFDAALGRYQRGPWRIDAFAAKPNTTASGLLDNGWMPGRTLWGLHLRRQASGGRQSLYYLGTRRRPSPTGAHLRVTRHTIGTRRGGEIGGLGYALEGAVQFGRYRRAPSSSGASSKKPDEGAIRAGFLAGRLSHQTEAIAGAPTVGLQAGWSSGDDGQTSKLETFAAPYPSGRVTGAGSRLGPGNLINVAPFLTLHGPAGIRLQLKSHFFWRSTTTDGIYAIWGAPLRDPSTDAHFIGAMPEALLSLDAGRHLNFALEASYFSTGPALHDGSSARDMIHLGLRATYVF